MARRAAGQDGHGGGDDRRVHGTGETGSAGDHHHLPDADLPRREGSIHGEPAPIRGAGLGRALLDKIIVIAGERGYCKVNLEVRDDNTVAKELYSSLGFQDTVPPMHFWTKFL